MIFVSFDKDSIVDEYVYIFLNELRKNSEICFISNSKIKKKDQDELSKICRKVLHIPHKGYDFGSYKRAIELIGWNRISNYDELLLINDSCYLVGELEPIFKKMDQVETEFWGMIPQKGAYHSKNKEENSFTGFKNYSEIHQLAKQEGLSFFEDFHVGAYFLGFRGTLLKEEGALDQFFKLVSNQSSKKNVVIKHEIGLTKYLIENNYNPSFYINKIYPTHPLYRESMYELLKEGFPFIKRTLFSLNHYQFPYLAAFLEKVIDSKCITPKKVIENNINRVVSYSDLVFTLNVKHNQDYTFPKKLSNQEFIELDHKSIINESVWAFPVCAYDHNLSGNSRAVFEKIKDDETIEKIIFFRSKRIALNGKNVKFLPLDSRIGQQNLIRSKFIFTKHSINDIIFPINPDKHKIINLWHGTAYKKFSTANLKKEFSSLLPMWKNHSANRLLIASSEMDKINLEVEFMPMPEKRIVVTGFPRNDFLLMHTNKLPADLMQESKKLNKVLKKRKLILYAPTFRKTKDKYKFSMADLEITRRLLEENNYVLGVREHFTTLGNTVFEQLLDAGESNILNFSTNEFPNTEILLREADLLITDYSSIFSDYTLLKRPIVFFQWDKEHYRSTQGLHYPDYLLPGRVFKLWSDVVARINEIIEDTNTANNNSRKYQIQQNIFQEYSDTENTNRIIKILKTI